MSITTASRRSRWSASCSRRSSNRAKRSSWRRRPRGDELEHYEELANIKDLIGASTSADDAERSKPHPDIFHAALGKIDGIDAADVIVVGDTPWDAIASGKAGLPIIGFLCGGYDEEKLREAGCMAIYANPADLLAHLDESPIMK